MAQTLYDKLWSSHVVHTEGDGTTLLYIDRHLVHEVTSPQAFEGLRQAGRIGPTKSNKGMPPDYVHGSFQKVFPTYKQKFF